MYALETTLIESHRTMLGNVLVEILKHTLEDGSEELVVCATLCEGSTMEKLVMNEVLLYDLDYLWKGFSKKSAAIAQYIMDKYYDECVAYEEACANY